MSNIMCHVTAEAVRETFENIRPFIVCRSGHAGIRDMLRRGQGIT